VSLVFLALVQSATPAPASPEARECAALVRSDPARAVDKAGEWRVKGGGAQARYCLGLAYSALERWSPAATAFELAALDAEGAGDPNRAVYWTQAGNAWLAGDDAARARKAFDAALATALLPPPLAGEAHLDRARAAVALGDTAAARADIDKGLELVPADPFAWYLSASLAQKSGDLARARTDIARAVEGAGDDADVLLLAGNIAGLSGDIEAARAFYARAVKAAPDSAAGKSAAAALTANSEETP
jgi:tetratricopeptide (TPR) repeat protein